MALASQAFTQPVSVRLRGCSAACGPGGAGPCAATPTPTRAHAR